MKEQLNIVCFLWEGDRWSIEQDMGYDYVNKLYRAVQMHLTLPHRFICLTNANAHRFDKGIELMSLNAPSWLGCLPKISMFNPELGLEGRVLSLDIDVVITGSLNDIASYDGDFAARSSFKEPHLLDGDIVGFRVGHCTDAVWQPLVDNPKKVEGITGGRERYWYRYVFGKKIDRFQTLYPDQILSYKNHLMRNPELPLNARIVSCHGKPRPHELTHIWAKRNWRNL